ncbi:hypothetical protein [Nitratireductor rhodophyticola]
MILPSAAQRKFLLVVHVATSVGSLGAIAVFLLLAIIGTVDRRLPPLAIYPALSQVAWWIIVPLVSGALLIGIIQSLVTPWGLFRHYWIIAKLGLTVFALGVLLLQLSGIDQLARAAADGSFTTDAFASVQASLILHASGGLVVVLLALVLSIYKPRGLTPYGARRLRSGQ